MRTPVLRKDEIVILGGDSGSANVGAAVVRGNPANGIAGARLIHLEYIQTKKAPKKMRRKIRVSTDDRRRLFEITDRFAELITEFSPDGLAVEWYVPNPYKRSRDGWKAAMTASGLLVLARERRVAPLEQLPSDVKKLTGMASASKEEVIEWLREHLSGFAQAIDKIARTNREHPSDAAGHAMAGILELDQRRKEAAL